MRNKKLDVAYITRGHEGGDKDGGGETCFIKESHLKQMGEKRLQMKTLYAFTDQGSLDKNKSGSKKDTEGGGGGGVQ